MSIIDFHTHRLNATDAMISVNPSQFDPQPGQWYSVGFHPWHDVDTLTDDDCAGYRRDGNGRPEGGKP